jgi:hypothetical protein
MAGNLTWCVSCSNPKSRHIKMKVSGDRQVRIVGTMISHIESNVRS